VQRRAPLRGHFARPSTATDCEWQRIGGRLCGECRGLNGGTGRQYPALAWTAEVAEGMVEGMGRGIVGRRVASRDHGAGSKNERIDG